MGIQSMESYFPADLLAAAKASWLNAVSKKEWLDPLHQDVSFHLDVLRIGHRNNEIVAEGQVCADCVLDGTKVNIQGSWNKELHSEVVQYRVVA